MLKITIGWKVGDQPWKYTSPKSAYPSIYENEMNSVIDDKKNENPDALGQSEQKGPINATTGESTPGYKNIYSSIKPYFSDYSELSYSSTQVALGDKAGILLPKENNKSYWVATRCIGGNSGVCHFMICSIDGRYGWYSNSMMESGGYPYKKAEGLFPVVTLKAGLLIKNEVEDTYDVEGELD